MAISLPLGHPLLHDETHQIHGLFKHNPRTIDSQEHQGQRLNALNELGSILNDLAYFRLPRSQSFEGEERQQTVPRGPQKKSGCWENAKRETGWTYWQCKDVFKQAPSSGLRFGSLLDCVDQLKHQRAETPLRFRKINNHAVLDQFHEIKSNDEAYFFLVKKLSEGNKKHKILRVVTAWRRQDEFRAVLCWNKIFRAQKDKIARLCTEPYRSRIMPSLDTWYFGPLRRKLARWLVNACEERLSAIVAAKKLADAEYEMIKAFTVSFTQAVDDDDDGALSLCELKSAELGMSNPMFVKAAIWLQSNRNFQKYAIGQDVHGVGVISTPELEAAMKVFLKDHWKFDGVLW